MSRPCPPCVQATLAALQDLALPPTKEQQEGAEGGGSGTGGVRLLTDEELQASGDTAGCWVLCAGRRLRAAVQATASGCALTAMVHAHSRRTWALHASYRC